MKKKITALLLVLLLLVSSLPVSAATAYTDPVLISKIDARLTGCPPVIGTRPGCILFDFTGPYGHLFEVDKEVDVGWLSKKPGADHMEDVTVFKAGVDYFYRTTINIKEQYHHQYEINFGDTLRINLVGANGQTIPVHRYSDVNTVYATITIGPVRAVENGITPLSRIKLQIEEPITLTGGGTLPTPALSSSMPDMTTTSITWYRDDGEAPALCYAGHKVIPLCAYFYEAVLECSDPSYVAVPKESMVVTLDGKRWDVTEVSTSGGKIFVHLWSPLIFAADNRITLKTATMTIPYALTVGSIPTLPEFSLPEGSPYTCTDVQWVDPETLDPISIDLPAVRGKEYGFAVTLEISGEAAWGYVFDKQCVALYNRNRGCSAQEVRINQVNGTSTCTAYLVGIRPRETDTTLFVGTPPEKRVYRPGEDFNPAGLEIGINENGEQFLVWDWLLTENTNLQPGQNHVTVHWQGLSLEVPIVVADDCPFIDIHEGSYYYKPVQWAVNNNITKGLDAIHFGPNASCTRAQVVTFLWNAANRPNPTSMNNPFEDVSAGSYYYRAVLWAVEKGITKGLDATHFGPNATCTRAQVAAFLWNASNHPQPTSTENPFVDISSDKYYYRAVLWAVEHDITKGLDPVHFGPNADCTRAQVVTFLWNANGKPAV